MLLLLTFKAVSDWLRVDPCTKARQPIGPISALPKLIEHSAGFTGRTRVARPSNGEMGCFCWICLFLLAGYWLCFVFLAACAVCVLFVVFCAECVCCLLFLFFCAACVVLCCVSV